MLGVFAEFERAIIQERINAGIARAREKGTKSGKPIGRARVDRKTEDVIRASLASGKGILKTARELKVWVEHGTAGQSGDGGLNDKSIMFSAGDPFANPVPRLIMETKSARRQGARRRTSYFLDRPASKTRSSLEQPCRLAILRAGSDT
jgi:hypothetical protein